MQVIFMKVNTKKSIKKAEKKASKILNKEMLDKLNNMKDEELDNLFSIINKNIERTPNHKFTDMYFNYVIGSNKSGQIGKVHKDAIKKELACEAESNGLIADKKWSNKLIDSSKKVAHKLAVIMNKPITKTLVLAGFSIALYYLHANQTVACSTGGNFGSIGDKIDKAYFTIRMTASVVCFIFMCVELSQNAVKGDMRVIWYIVVKYIALIIAIVSYRKIFFIIDGLFN